MDHCVSSWRQRLLPSSPIGPAVTSTQASDQFKGYSADTYPPGAEVHPNGCTANRPADRERVATPAGDANLIRRTAPSHRMTD